MVKLEHYYFPGELEAEIGGFVAYYNNERHHESLHDLTRPQPPPVSHVQATLSIPENAA